MLLTSQQNIVLIKLCELILDTNKEICFAAVVNKQGRILESKSYHGVGGSLPSVRQDMFFMKYAMRQMMRKECYNDFDSVKYAHAKREKKTLFSFPLHNFLVIVAARIGVNPVSVSRKIITIIEDYKIKLDKKTNIEKGLVIQ